MVLVHRLKGEPFYVNVDLLESIESIPDTVLTLLDGRRFVVAEPPEVVVERVVHFRAAVLAAAEALRTGRPALTVVRGEEV